MSDFLESLHAYLDRSNEDLIRRAAVETVCILAVDLETEIIIQIDRLVEAMFGYEEGELKGKSIHVLVPDRYVEVHKVHFSMFRGNPVRRTMGTRGVEIPGKRKDGTEFPLTVGLAKTQITINGDRRDVGVGTMLNLGDRAEVNPVLKPEFEKLEEYAHGEVHTLRQVIQSLQNEVDTLKVKLRKEPGEQGK